MYDTNGSYIDRFVFRPNETPENVAVDLVNATLQSPKVGSYAGARRSEPIGERAAPAAEATTESFARAP